MWRGLVLAVLVGLSGMSGAAAEDERPLGFADLPAWRDDDHAAALRTYRETCRRTPACRASRRAAGKGAVAARHFFETWFEPVEIAPAGFLTGYFEPEISGSLQPDATHTTALLSRPAGLVAKPAGASDKALASWPEGLAAARRTRKGYEPMPDRAAIEEGALAGSSRPLLYVDPVDAFMIQVQGSARIGLADGTRLRVGFDGKNGYPYTAIGKVLAERENIPPAEMTADKLWAWLRANPDEAPAIMRRNRSFVFFKLAKTEQDRGPVGAAGASLAAGRSLAVDRSAWPYGTLVWLEGELPRPEGGTVALRRLTVAQDTGTAIVGRARGDLFFGSGAEAGAEAGLVRQPVRWVVLREKRPPAKKRGRR